MQNKSETYNKIQRILKDVEEGLKNVAPFALYTKGWDYRATNIHEQFKTFQRDHLSLNVKSTEKRKSKNMDIPEIPEETNQVEMMKQLNAMMLDIFELLFLFRHTNMPLSQALINYLEFLTTAYTNLLLEQERLRIQLPSESDDRLPILSGQQLSIIYSHLYKGASDHLFSDRFRPMKKNTKKTLETTLDAIFETRKDDIIKQVNDSLAGTLQTQIKIIYEPSSDNSHTNVDFKNIDSKQKNEYFNTFCDSIKKILDLQKEYPLDPGFGEAVRQFFKFLMDNYVGCKHDSILLTTRIECEERALSRKPSFSRTPQKDNNNVISIENRKGENTSEDESQTSRIAYN